MNDYNARIMRDRLDHEVQVNASLRRWVTGLAFTALLFFILWVLDCP